MDWSAVFSKVCPEGLDPAAWEIIMPKVIWVSFGGIAWTEQGKHLESSILP